MRHFLMLFAVIITSFLSNPLKSQVIWTENFQISEKGVWADSLGTLKTDFTEVDWNLDYSKAIFATDGDYAKTVSTSGGRFEVIDSDGDVTWTSPFIDISAFQNVKISLSASETGSSTGADKKYIKAYYLLDEVLYPFSPNAMASGNWSTTTLVQQNLNGKKLQLSIVLNSSYANDKVILDDIVIEGIDTTLSVPVAIETRELPQVMVAEKNYAFSFVLRNKEGKPITEKTYEPIFESNSITASAFTFLNGVYSCNIQSKTPGEQVFKVVIKDNNLPELEKKVTIYSQENLLAYENFEGGLTTNWQTNNHWELSQVEPISGNQSIKHMVQPANGVSYLEYSHQPIFLNDGNYIFSFKMKNGNWDPSSSNTFYVTLLNDLITGSNQETDFSEGYAIGVNATGSSDLVSIWKIEQGKVTTLLMETALDWNANTLAQIDFLRSPDGTIFLHATDLVSKQTYSANTKTQHTSIVSNVAIHYIYTQTRSGQLWFDDFLIARSNTGPIIQQVSVNTMGELQVIFSEAVKTDKLSLSSFQLTGSSGQTYPLEQMKIVNSNSILLKHGKIDELTGMLRAINPEDMEGMATPVTELAFEFLFPLQPFDLVINEIMADPSPVVDLPNAEYIELWNRSNKFIRLNGCALKVGNTTKTLPDTLLSPGQFTLLCNSSDSILFASLTGAHRTNVNGFPSLLNSGTSILLIAPDRSVIDSISYTDKWYNDTKKNDGGWSMERISPHRFCGQQANWSASTDPSGGTPGRVNSVLRPNDDNTPPYIVSAKATSYTTVQVSFSEPVTLSELQSAGNFATTPSLALQGLEYNAAMASIQITFTTPILKNTAYTLKLNRLTDECRNTATNQTADFSITILQPGDVLLSEVLFNPYVNGADFVEIYNNTNLTLDAASFSFATRDDSLKLRTIYTIAKNPIPFRPGSYLAFTKNSESISNHFTIKYPENLIQIDNIPSLADAKGRIVLLSDSLIILDEFAYTEYLQSELFSSREGVSLERVSFTKATNEPGNWYSSSTIAGYATPGYANSQNDPGTNTKVKMELSSDVVSPNGDGFNDELEITFHLNEPGYVVNLYIFDAAGRMVQRLANNDLIGHLNTISYNCRKNNGELLLPGTYVLLAELLHPKGKKEAFKKAFLVTDRM